MSKSEIMLKKAKECGIPVREFEASSLEDSDFVGIPVRVESLEDVLARLDSLRLEAVGDADFVRASFWRDTALFLGSDA